MSRDKEQTVGAGLFVVGTILLALPVMCYRSKGTVTAVVAATVTVFPGLLALAAGRKLRRYSPRREISLEDVKENAARYRFWNRLGLV